jgi:hypothetical protein
MAIVAREKDILMQVACKGLGQIETGVQVTVSEDGSITLVEDGQRRQAVSA